MSSTYSPDTTALWQLAQFYSCPATVRSTSGTWQDVIYDWEEKCALEHPQFQEMMEELVKRAIMSVNWKWTVDIEDTNLALTRAVVEGLMAWSSGAPGTLPCVFCFEDSVFRNSQAIAVVLLDEHDERVRFRRTRPAWKPSFKNRGLSTSKALLLLGAVIPSLVQK